MEFGWVGNLHTFLSPTMDSLRSWWDKRGNAVLFWRQS